MAKGRLEIVVESDPDKKTINMTLKFPDRCMEFRGNLNSLRTMANGDLEAFKPFIGPAGLQDLRVDLRRILLNVEKEFGENSEIPS